MPTKWFGDAILAGIVEAQKRAIDETTEAAAQLAESEHWWHTRGGNLERQTISERARVRGRTVVGRFGTTRRRGFYGLFLEYREGFLRPAADREFPGVQARLAEKVKEIKG